MASNVPFAGDDKKFFTLQQFGTLNTKSKREAIGEQEFAWVENMMPVGDGNLQAMYSNGSSIYTAPAATTIIYTYFYNIGATTYAAVFLDDGTATQINTSTKAQTVISSNPGEFFPGDPDLGNPAPACAQYGQSGLLIVGTASVDCYFAWDGTTLFRPGDPSPSWLNDNTPTTMPSGISGTCIETFLSRVWIGLGAKFFNSAPSNGADFSAPDGGGATPSSDSFLRREFTQIKQANGFNYLFADSSVNVISNVQTGGTPVLTTFNNQNIDPQTGTPWHSSVQAFGRGLVFANAAGVYAIYGGAAEKISDQLDGIFTVSAPLLKATTTIDQPSAAVMTINDIKTYMLLVPVRDPFTTTFRNALVMWDGKKWFLGSQDSTLTFIASQEIDSILQAWGTDGTDLFPLFTTPSATLNKIWRTKLWQGDGFQIVKQAMRFYTMAEDNSGLGYSISATLDAIGENTGLTTQSFTILSQSYPITWLNNSNQIIQFRNNSLQNINFATVGPSINGIGLSSLTSRGCVLGATLQSTSPDFTIIAHSLLYQNQSPLGA